MYQQIEVIIAQSREFTRRRNLLDPDDQKRADYLLKRIEFTKKDRQYKGRYLLCNITRVLFHFSVTAPICCTFGSSGSGSGRRRTNHQFNNNWHGCFLGATRFRCLLAWQTQTHKVSV